MVSFADIFQADKIIQQIRTCIHDAGTEAFTFYSSGVRNQYFYAETICRIGRDLGSEAVFEKHLKKFKEAEDILGQYDFYFSLSEATSHTPECRERFEELHGENFATAGEKLHHLLDEERETKQHSIFLKDCREIEFDKPDKLRIEFGAFLIKAIQKLSKGWEKGEFNPDEIEAGIHELRRKLRWLSLYAQVSNGLIQLTGKEEKSEIAKLYVTREILKSPFLQFPKAQEGIRPLEIQFTHFAALSSLIATLGELKDAGLALEALNAEEKPLKCLTAIPEGYSTLSSIRKEAEKHTHNFFDKHQLPKLIVADIENSITA
jgi:hypothetical protein